MTLGIGDWVELPDLSIARIVEVSGDPVIVRAERPGRGVVEMPLNYATSKWARLPPDGLRVAWTTNPAGLRDRADREPVDLVVLALVDANGSATTRELREILERVVGSDKFSSWWKRTQRRLEVDPRIDTREALQHRYRLVREGERIGQRLRPLLSDRKVGDRVLADAPRLLDARERVKTREPLDAEAISDLETVVGIARDSVVDATDRFLAGEISVMLRLRPDMVPADEPPKMAAEPSGLGQKRPEREPGDGEAEVAPSADRLQTALEPTEADLASTLGDDIFHVDLMRIRDHASRTRALRIAGWRLRQGERGDPPARLPILGSAVAVGKEWRDEAFKLGMLIGLPQRELIGWGILWAAPGSAEAGETNYPVDLERYLRRASELFGVAASAPKEGSAALVANTLSALEVMAGAPQKGRAWSDAMAGLAIAMWELDRDSSVVSAVRARRAVAPSALDAIVLNAPDSSLGALEPLVEDAYAADGSKIAALATLVGRQRRDLRAVLVSIGRRVIDKSRARAIALEAIHTIDGEPESQSEALVLAGAIWPDHPDVVSRLSAITKAAEDEIADGEVVQPGPRLFDERSWRRLVARIHEVIASATLEREHAAKLAAEAEKLAREVATAAERRRLALEESRTTTQAATSTNARRIAANVLKPIAQALSDSAEARSLNALQDQLIAILARARIRPLGTPGDIVDFDPARHVWVGSGEPQHRVLIVAPGYITELEGGDELVLTAARVVHPD